MNNIEYPFRWESNFRTSWLKRLVRALSDAMRDLGYTVKETQSPESTDVETSDVTAFIMEITGNKLSFHTSKWLATIEIVLVLTMIIILAIPSNWTMVIVGIALIPLIIGLLLAFSQIHTRVLVVLLEGKSRKTSFKVRDYSGMTTDIVSDTHLVIAGRVKNKHDNLTSSSKEQLIVKEDFVRFIVKVETLLHSFTVT